jgi:type VI secretion system secreted protein VgrG
MKLFNYHAKRARPRCAATPAVGLALLAVLVTLSFTSSALSAQATVDLGNAGSFGALSFTAMTNNGANTVVYGNIGSPTSIDAGVTHPGYAAYGAGSPQLAMAQASLLTAYGSAEAATPNRPSITGMNLAGRRLDPGVYNSTGGILISGPIALTLDGGGDPNAVFIFQAASSGDLTVDPTSSVTYTNGAQPCNVFWKVNSAFLKNTDQTFVGTILALTQITLTEHITVEGRVLARNADVTFIHDTINRPTCATAQTTTDTTPATTTDTTTTTTTATTPAATTTTTPTTATTTTTTTTPATTTTRPATTTAAVRPVVKPRPTPLKVTPTPKPRPPVHRFGLTG